MEITKKIPNWAETKQEVLDILSSAEVSDTPSSKLEGISYEELNESIIWTIHSLLYLSQEAEEYKEKGMAMFKEWKRRFGHIEKLLDELEYIDYHIMKLINLIPRPVHLFILSDHGTCFGEDGLHHHGFYHPKIIEVPMVSIELE